METGEALKAELDRVYAREAELTKEGREILRDAADYIAEHGWNQGSYRDDHTGGVCALGAIWSVRDGLLHNTDPEFPNVQYLANHLPACDQALILLSQSSDRSNIPAWNDAPERTAEDVILAMKRAAEEA